MPRGSLTADGTIQAGEVEVAVVAAAIGPGANVRAEAIDTILNESVDGTPARIPGTTRNGGAQSRGDGGRCR